MEPNELKERMHSGRLYYPGDPSLMAQQALALEKLWEFNRTRPSELPRREALLKEMLAEIGENCYIEPPFYANWAGKHVHFGSGVYANFNLTMVDDTHIYVGDQVMFGPNVTICTAAHPIGQDLRRKQAQYNKPVRIGSNVWVGANVTILPGVTIGDNTVIGAGSVVTRDIPANVVALGTPCRVLREIGEQDAIYYDHDKRIDIE
ncbi:MAG: sugar O-acetyltransferase [Eubacteriales bacterium]|nr:sugar O-acetyltransferase [Eubacteriales bacterium]